MPFLQGSIPWNKGKTALDHPGIAASQAKNTGQKRTGEQRLFISERTKASGQKAWNRNPNREEQRVKYLVIKRMRSMLERTMLRLGTKKERHTHEQLGYDSQQLKEHLESLFKPGMTWENHGKGNGKWHVDHIQRLADFPIGTSASVVNSLQNLQPLWQEENLKKG